MPAPAPNQGRERFLGDVLRETPVAGAQDAVAEQSRGQVAHRGVEVHAHKVP